MAKKDKTPRVEVRKDPVEENHMQLFARLAAVKNMHGHPGPRKPKGK